MKLARQGKISYLQPAWAANGSVCAGFTNRNGGVSRAPYNSLNLGFNTGDRNPRLRHPAAHVVDRPANAWQRCPDFE